MNLFSKIKSVLTSNEITEENITKEMSEEYECGLEEGEKEEEHK